MIDVFSVSITVANALMALHTYYNYKRTKELIEAIL